MQISQINTSAHTLTVQQNGANIPRAASGSDGTKPLSVQVEMNIKPVDQVKQQVSVSKLEQATQKINQAMLANNLQFTVDKDTGINVVKVVDTVTKEVIRQFPSEEVLAIAKVLDQLQGLLLREKA